MLHVQEQGHNHSIQPTWEEAEEHAGPQGCHGSWPHLVYIIILCTFLHFYPEISDTRVSKDLMEHRFGRESVLDGITSLRSLMSKLLAFAHAPLFMWILNYLDGVLNYVDGPPWTAKKVAEV